MVIELIQKQQLKLLPAMTLRLQQSIKLLQLSSMELVERVQQELAENPVLEAVEESEDKQTLEELEAISKYLDEHDSRWRNILEYEVRESPNFENYTVYTESLTVHLLYQLLMTSPTKEGETIGSVIAGSLDKNGYLKASVDQIAAMSNTGFDKTQRVLSLMQTFDPPGVCARDLGECLLIQIKNRGIENETVKRIIQDHLKDLENKNYKNICRALKTKKEDISKAINIIQSLEPRPGRQFDNLNPNYIVPDIFVFKSEGKWVIRLNNSGMPVLRFSSYCKKILAERKKITSETKKYLKQKKDSANWLIQSIYFRHITFYRVMESILKFQKDFFEKGIAHLKPLVLKDVADDIWMSESTVSRINAKKYVQTPWGIFSLKYFFSSPVNGLNGKQLANKAVQNKIRIIIANEDPAKPLSDDKIKKILKEGGIKLARRTVTKYRENLGILASTKRKQL